MFKAILLWLFVALFFAHNQLQSSKSSIAALIVDYCFEQVNAAEVGPEGFGDVDFTVCALPEKKI